MHTLKQRDTDTPGENTMRLPVYIRFADLVENGIVSSWMQLSRLIASEGFPEGVRLSANIRAWEIGQIHAWLATRPTARKIMPCRKHRQQDKHEAKSPAA